jgi:hypothetical protein
MGEHKQPKTEPDVEPVQGSPTPPKENVESTKRQPAQDNSDAQPGELLTGQGDPGLTLTGGGGHA